MANFIPNCLPLLIGSVPMKDHAEATRFVLEHTPQIPLWVQLPAFAAEGMVEQFLPGLPGITRDGDRVYIDRQAEAFQTEAASFYEEYLAAAEDPRQLDGSRFALTDATARGFSVFTEIIKGLPEPPVALKGQTTGPVTMGIGLKDQDGRFALYDDTLRDLLTKHLAQKAAWQARQLGALGPPAILFFDEPGLVSFGTSAYISMSREMVAAALAEVIGGVHAAGGLAGVHVCGNADWSLLLESQTDIISFDAYSYFDKFMLFAGQIKTFLARGGMLAWGIVPTGRPEDVEKESLDSLYAQWLAQLRQLEQLGIARERILAQTLITPSCGTGSLSLAHATKVLTLTGDLSRKARAEQGMC